MAVNEYSTRHRAELGAALRARQTGTPYISPTPSTDRLMGRSATRRLLPSLIPEPEIRTGMRPMTPVSYEEEYGEYGGTMSEAMTEAGIADAAAKAAKRRAARDLLLERRDVAGRGSEMFVPQLRSVYDQAAGEHVWYLTAPFKRTRTGADILISRIRAEIARAAGYPEGDERVTVGKLTIDQIADTDILREKFSDPTARRAGATRLFKTIKSRGVSISAAPKIKGWTKIGTDKATRQAIYETRARTAVAWAIANIKPETAPGTEMPLPPEIMQQIMRAGGVEATERIEQQLREEQKKREATAIRRVAEAEILASPDVASMSPEERKRRTELAQTRALTERGYRVGKKAAARLAIADALAEGREAPKTALGLSYAIPRPSRPTPAPAAQEPAIPRPSAPSGLSYALPRRPSPSPAASGEGAIPRPPKPKTNPSRRR